MEVSLRIPLVSEPDHDLDEIGAATGRPRRRCAGKDRIGPRVDKVIGKQKVAKHFELEIADDGFTWQRNRERIAEKAALDGLYVIRTSVPERALGAEDTVRA